MNDARFADDRTMFASTDDDYEKKNGTVPL